MEDQGKRLLLAVAIAFGLMLLWTVLFPPDPPTEVDGEDEQRVEEERAPDDDGADEAPEPDDVSEAAPDEVAEPEEEREPRPDEELFEFEFDEFRSVFSSYGGALTSWELKDERWEKNGQLLDLVKTGDRTETRPFRVAFEDSTHDIPADAVWTGERLSDREIRFEWASDDLRVTKQFSIDPERYLLSLDVDVELLRGDAAEQALAVYLYGYQDPHADTGGGIARVDRIWQSACLIDGDIERRTWEDLEEDGDLVRSGPVSWAGFQHSYFLAAAAPRSDETRLRCDATAVPRRTGEMEMAIRFPFEQLQAGAEPASHELTAYLGPKYLSDLNAISDEVGYETGYERAVDFGFMGLLARPLLWLLIWFQGFVVNWGLAIILLTFTVKAATHYWTHKSMKSMREMGKLRPDIEELQKKYKDDPQRMRVEMMNLYKSRGVNPLSGCLPILLQMPIWFALYRTLTTAGELYQAPFIAGWIDDLTTPDPYYILPVLLMGMMFLQSRFTPVTGDSMQQKVLMYGMPLIFGGFSIFFPAGLTLYIFTSTGLTALHHIYLRRVDPAPVPKPGGDKSDDKEKGGGKGATADKGKAKDDSAVAGGEAKAELADGAEDDADGEDRAEDAPEGGGSAKPRKKGAKKKSGKKKRSR